MSFESNIVPAPQQSRVWRACSRILKTPLMPWLVSGLLVVAAIAQQAMIGLDTDVSWLLIVGERVLDGERLYVDIFEVNPPASVLIYLPAIALARAFRWTPEFATASFVLLLALGALWLAGRSLRRAGLLHRRWRGPLLCSGLFCFVFLPGALFAQREHMAVLTLLPFIAVLTVRMKGRSVDLGTALLAGMGGGVTMAIKPHFALAVALMVICLMWKRRSIGAGLHAETWAAGGVVLAYALLIATVYPVYLTDALPLLRTVYIPVRVSLQEIWLKPALLLFWTCCVLSLFLARCHLARSRALLLLLGALGFAAALGVQGKGYLNHAYPSVALGIFAIVLILAEGHGDKKERAVGAFTIGLFGVLSCYVFIHVRDYADVAQLVKRVAPAQPRIIVAGSNLSVGHPLTRWVNGQWVGRRGALWVTGMATELLEEPMDGRQRAKLLGYVEQDRRIFVEDVVRRQPDVILVPGVQGLRWIESHEEVAKAMRPYRRAGVASDIHVLVRQPQIRSTRDF